ncbi:MAG TPA: DUF4184 family protein [Polyangia bacterium]
MPLTPCHAAAAWALVRIFRLPVAAVVIGAMAPDFLYLLRLRPSGNFGHTLPGIVLFCLPTSLVVWALFTKFVRPWLVSLVPLSREGWARPPGRRDASQLQRLWLVTTGIVAGALSHVTWDAFTHDNGWGVQWFPVLARTLRLPGTSFEVHVYSLLQHGSTLFGGLFVLAWASSTVRDHRSVMALSSAQRRRLVRAGAGLAGATTAGAVINGARAWERGLHHVLAHAAVGGMVALVAALLAMALHQRRREPRAQREFGF